MTADDMFNAASPDPSWSAALTGLWYAEQGDWHGAHEAVQDDASAEGSWVHACLHREEGDLGNAGYWYSRAGQPVATGDFGAERRAIATALLT